MTDDTIATVVVSPAAPPQRRAVSLRSVGLGLCGVCVLCGLTAFNDYAVNNTPLIGLALPTGFLALFTLFVLCINAPLLRWRPRLAFSSAELSVALGMTLVSCAIPSVGLYRYLPGHLTSVWYQSAADSSAADVMRQLDLPDWMFPTFQHKDPRARGNEPVITEYARRANPAEQTFAGYWQAVPWRLWLRPAVTWGLMLIALWGAFLCLSAIFYRQWAVNERLAFPLGTIFLSLIEPPAPGRYLNAMFGSRGFWMAFGTVFTIHVLNGLHAYAPITWPEIPLRFNLSNILADEPWRYADGSLKMSGIYFTIIGILFFVQTRTAFSLWFGYLLFECARMGYGMYGSDYSEGMQVDYRFGGIIAFSAAVLWVGRHHLKAVFVDMFRRSTPKVQEGEFISNRAAGWGLVICVAGFIGWLLAAGASLAGAVVLAAMLILLLLCCARIVTETGWPYMQLHVPLVRPWIYAGSAVPAALTTRTTMRSYFLSNLFWDVFAHDMRESLPTFSMHALYVEAHAEDEPGERRRRPGFMLALVLALAVGYVVAGASMLYVEYRYAITLDTSHAQPINGWGAQDFPHAMMDRTRAYLPPHNGDPEAHNKVGHFAFGLGTVSLLSILRLRFEWWPFHPIGFLLAATWGVQTLWFSILLGWLVKLLIVQFGGAGLYRRAKPFILGMILGESAAAALWLVVGLVRLGMGLDYQAIHVLPI